MNMSVTEKATPVSAMTRLREADVRLVDLGDGVHLVGLRDLGDALGTDALAAPRVDGDHLPARRRAHRVELERGFRGRHLRSRDVHLELRVVTSRGRGHPLANERLIPSASVIT